MRALMLVCCCYCCVVAIRFLSFSHYTPSPCIAHHLAYPHSVFGVSSVPLSHADVCAFASMVYGVLPVLRRDDPHCPRCRRVFVDSTLQTL